MIPESAVSSIHDFVEPLYNAIGLRACRGDVPGLDAHAFFQGRLNDVDELFAVVRPGDEGNVILCKELEQHALHMF